MILKMIKTYLLVSFSIVESLYREFVEFFIILVS